MDTKTPPSNNQSPSSYWFFKIMDIYIALLRAVNVGGTGKLKMDELRSLCTELGLLNVKTYIASGNIVFQSNSDPDSIKQNLEEKLHVHTGKLIPVLIRTEAELLAALEENPFKNAAPNKTLITFLDEPAPSDTLESVKNRLDEEIYIGSREIFVHYVEGISNSKLKIPAAKSGTARNLNTVNKLVGIASSLGA
jgi:uncharacterized protein (DUF1697 family)